MAGYPPPYPPPAGTPFGFDPRQQRRIYREQVRSAARAQRDSFRAQRDLYRMQARSLRRGSILGPLIVVTVGVVLLLISFGRLPLVTFELWYGRWWPVLLVAAGAILLLEWVFDQRRSEGSTYVRRGVGGGIIFLLILLGLTGALAQQIHEGTTFLHGLNINRDNFDEFLGDKHELEQQIEEPFAPGTTLSIENPHGDVTVVGVSNDDKIRVTVNKQIYSRTDSDADARGERLSPRLDRSGSSLNLVLPAIDGAVSNLTVSVPEGSATIINANHGDVHVSTLRAPLTVTANHGDVELNTLAGAVTAHVNHNGSSFSAHSVTGAISLRGHAQDVTVTDTTGEVSLEGEFYGETHLERIKGPVHFQTSRTHFSLVRLDGEIDISPNSELTGREIVGPTELQTRSRNISFDRISGDVNVSNSNGTVDLTAQRPLGNVTIENKTGAVNLTFPDHAGIEVQAETRGGEVEDDFSLNHSSHDDRASLNGKVGDGAAQVIVHTTHADIGIHKGGDLPPAPPAALEPAPPPTPASPATKPHPKPRSPKPTPADSTAPSAPAALPSGPLTTKPTTP